VYFMPLPAISRRRHSVFELSVCSRVRPWSYTNLVNTISYHLREFHQVYGRSMGTKITDWNVRAKRQKSRSRPEQVLCIWW